MFITVLITKDKNWKSPKSSLTDEWLQIWCIYRMEYYSRRNEWNPINLKNERTIVIPVQWNEPDTDGVEQGNGEKEG